ncbi:MAG: TIGR04438 family Trp-rich protein [Burkholderiaceae bacterium]
MALIILIAALAVLKLLDVSAVAALSWWWIAGLTALAFAWFELVEPLLGLDKRRAHDDIEQAKANRIRKAFGKPGNTRRP